MTSIETTTTNAERVAWVDVCKGVCILLVVYGHIAGGLGQSKVFGQDSIFSVLRDWVYLFHIPAFFFLSGLFARRATDKPFLVFLRGRSRTLLYPYVIWTAIILLSQLLMRGFVNSPVSASRALLLLWEPYGVGLWFLYALFLCSLYLFGLRRWRVPTAASLLIVTVLYVLASRKVFGFWYILNESFVFAVYFVLGASFPGIAANKARLPRWALAAVAAGVFAIMTLSVSLGWDSFGLLRLARAVLGVGAVVCFAMAMDGTALASPLAFLGRFSLEIYLAHPLWGTASRGLLLRAGVHAAPVFVVSGVVIGVAGSLAMAVACERWNFPYLFRWPRRDRARAAQREAA